MYNDIKEDAKADHIEIVILRQILAVSLLTLLLYLVNSFLIVKSDVVFKQSLIVFAFYLLLFSWTFFPGQFITKKRIITLILFLSVVAGFFTIGGLRGLTAFDLANMFLFISVMYKDKERDSYLVIMFAVFVLLFTIHVVFPQVITNHSAADPDWMVAMNVFVRVLLAVNVVIALRNAYSSEHSKVTKLLEEVNHLNVDITAQNEELKSMQEELRSNNEKLESLVLERTRKLELQNETLIMYAYLNSHVFRGPVCRIQGILNLLDIEKDENIKKDLQHYLSYEVQEIDKVIKDISRLLYETDAEFLEQIRLKAKKLYKF